MAMLRLGHLYLRGLGVRQSCKTATKFFKEVVEEAVFGPSITTASQFFWDGNDALSARAVNIFLHAADAGVASAQASAVVMLDAQDAPLEFDSFVDDNANVGDRTADNAVKTEIETEAMLSAADSHADWETRLGAWLWDFANSIVREFLEAETDNCSGLKLQLLQNAARQDHVQATIALGDCYYAEYVSAAKELRHHDDDLARQALTKESQAQASLAAQAYFKASQLSSSLHSDHDVDSHSHALFNLAFLHMFGPNIEGDRNIAQRHCDAIVAANPQVCSRFVALYPFVT